MIWYMNTQKSWVCNVNFGQNRFKAVIIKHEKERRNGQATIIGYYIYSKEQGDKKLEII